MNVKRVAVPLIAIIIIAGIAIVFWRAYSPAPFILQGQIEARQHMVASKIPGRVADITVRRGDHVEAGAQVFRIDSPELEAKLTQMEALETISQSLAQAVEGGTREERIAAARSEYEKALAAEALAKTTYGRIRALADEGLVARQRADDTFTLWKLAEKTRVTASEILKLAEAGPRQESRTASRAGEAATSSLRSEVAELLDDTIVVAHKGGVVSNVLLNEGELAPQGFPVVIITDLEDAWALFNVREDFLHRVGEGTEFDLEIPALGQTAPFRVSHIAVLGDYATWRATTPGKGFDMKTFEVEMQPVNPVPGLRAGMSVLLEMAP
nr:biotin/lipoyl-binding protein [uncultured Marinobacter sp.]